MLLLYCDTCGTRLHNHKGPSFEVRTEESRMLLILSLCTDCEILHVKPIVDANKKVRSERGLT